MHWAGSVVTPIKSDEFSRIKVQDVVTNRTVLNHGFRMKTIINMLCHALSPLPIKKAALDLPRPLHMLLTIILNHVLSELEWLVNRCCHISQEEDFFGRPDAIVNHSIVYATYG